MSVHYVSVFFASMMFYQSHCIVKNFRSYASIFLHFLFFFSSLVPVEGRDITPQLIEDVGGEKWTGNRQDFSHLLWVYGMKGRFLREG